MKKEKNQKDLLEELKYYKHLSYHDIMTDCFNRNWFETIFLKTYRGKDFYLAFADINGLKKVNDEHGHSAGDKLIRDIAKALSKFGKTIRNGGDEFLIILKDETAKATFETCFANDKHVAFGIALHTKGKDIYSTIRESDAIMYENKRAKKKSL